MLAPPRTRHLLPYVQVMQPVTSRHPLLIHTGDTPVSDPVPEPYLYLSVRVVALRVFRFQNVKSLRLFRPQTAVVDENVDVAMQHLSNSHNALELGCLECCSGPECHEGLGNPPILITSKRPAGQRRPPD